MGWKTIHNTRTHQFFFLIKCRTVPRTVLKLQTIHHVGDVGAILCIDYQSDNPKTYDSHRAGSTLFRDRGAFWIRGFFKGNALIGIDKHRAQKCNVRSKHISHIAVYPTWCNLLYQNELTEHVVYYVYISPI